MTTSLQLSKDIEKYMEGADSFFTWQRRMDMFGKWGKWCLRYPGTYQHCNVDNPYKVESQDAYTLDDLRSRLPIFIYDNDDWARGLYVDLYGKNIGYGDIDRQTIKKIKYDNENVSLTEAAGKLLKHLGEEGYLDKEAT